MLSTYSLKDLLQNFLAQRPKLIYPPIELCITQMEPLQVVDSELNKVELPLIQDKVLSSLAKFKNSKFRTYKLILNKWKFVFP